MMFARKEITAPGTFITHLVRPQNVDRNRRVYVDDTAIIVALAERNRERLRKTLCKMTLPDTGQAVEMRV